MLFTIQHKEQEGKSLSSTSLVGFLRKDGRHYQIFYQSIFLLYGLFFLNWETDLWRIALAIGVCLISQIFWTSITTKNWASLKSALTTALSLCLILKANSPYTIAFAAVLSISSKYLIMYKMKHVFNPSNFGIIAVIILTGDAWISPGQWGSDWLLIIFVGICGMSVLFQVGRLNTSLGFILAFAGAQFVYHIIYLGWPMDFFIHQISSGTLLLFTFFMITDPVTTPNHPKARFIWAMIIGFTAFGLTTWMHVHTAPLWALFFLSPITVILDRSFLAEKFQWKIDKHQSIIQTTNQTS